MNDQLIPRSLDLDNLILYQGNHYPGNEMCIMEAVAFIAGEEWSDRPKCASPVITELAQGLNDNFSDKNRSLLIPYILRIIGTASDQEVEDKRLWTVLDWIARTRIPEILSSIELDKSASKLTELDPVAKCIIKNHLIEKFSNHLTGITIDKGQYQR